MSDVSYVIFYAGKMLQTIEFPLVALTINLFEGLLSRPPRFIKDSSLIRPAAFVVLSIILVLYGAPQYGAYVLYWLSALQEIIVL
jgi:hypothetical protein